VFGRIARFTNPMTKTAQMIRAFDGCRDTFAFANETVWNYEGGRVQWERDNPTREGVRYTRRCFVLARSAAQFWNFARFAPAEPQVNAEELARRIRTVVARPLWHRQDNADWIVLPGYADLRTASGAEPQIFRNSLGGWGQSYFRWGNWRIVLPLGRRNQQNVARELRRLLAANGLQVLWLVNFPSLTINHAVLAVREHRAGASEFEVYDPNLPDESLRLTFDESTGRFHYPKTFYFSGGAVGVRLVYHRPWQ
jgi:hypothetical protein